MQKLLIIGASGHGKVVADAAFTGKEWNEIAFLDDRYSMMGNVLGRPVLNSVSQAVKYRDEYRFAVVAIGNNKRRMELHHNLELLGFQLATIVHPMAVIGMDVSIGAGSVVFANAVINVASEVGKSCIINTSSSIDHDCSLGDGVHVSPGASVAGGVVVGHRAWIGIGSSVTQCCKIEDDAVIGAGAVVIDNVRRNTTVVGVPAKPLES
jgi:sugar O-acyltransferase (sialic acid O-acetyltransferase NeuD family)